MHRTVQPVLFVVLGVFAASTALATSSACSSAAKPAPESGADAAELAVLGNRVAELDKRLVRIEKLLAEALEPTKEPDPAALYAVPIDGDPFEGAADAKVTVVKAFEFACGYCYRARPTVDKILATYGGDVKVVYKYYVVHEQAVAPGLAVCAAHRQGKFKAMKDLIWDKGFAQQDISGDKMKELAGEVGLDVARFAEDIAEDGSCMDWLKSGYGMLSKLGVRGTPAWYVNGRFVSGAQPFPRFKTLIDAELAKANAKIAKGVSVADYYREEIVAKGATEL